jgi:hypothetical protein
MLHFATRLLATVNGCYSGQPQTEKSAIDECPANKDTSARNLPMQLKWKVRFDSVVRSVALLVALFFPVVTFAQSCALCYTQAAGAGQRIIQALRSGILILVAPPVLICIALTVMAYKKRNQFNEE